MYIGQRLGTPMANHCVRARAFHIPLLAAFALGSPLASPREISPQDPYKQAILIGVWDYDERTYDLGSMDSDLLNLAKSFTDLEFDVVNVMRNPDQKQVDRALRDASNVAVGLGEERAILTVVYFAGHGTMVDSTSYLLTRDYAPPQDSSELALNGGIAADYIGEVFARVGQPLLLIVEACRNSFVPSAPDDLAGAGRPFFNAADGSDTPWRTTFSRELNLGAGAIPAEMHSAFLKAPDAMLIASMEETQPPRMIDVPTRNLGYAVFYGQSPGQIIEIPPRRRDQNTPLVNAIANSIQLTGIASVLFANVSDQVAAETAGQTHPLVPEYFDRGAGELYMRYDDDEREVDRRRWEKVLARDRAELVKGFLAGFRTSRYTAIAKKWLRDEDVKSMRRQYAAAVDKTGPSKVPSSGVREVEPVSSGLHGGVAIPPWVKNVEMVRRLPTTSPTFEVRTADGRTKIFEHVVWVEDSTKNPDFWSGESVVPVGCDASQISSGACVEIERLAELARSSSPSQVGTIFVASILDGNRPDAVAMTFERTLAIAVRLSSLGVESGAVGFRTFYRVEIPNTASSILIRRGNGASILSGG
jgi:hypothetical protein